jgi:hypothetical protein
MPLLRILRGQVVKRTRRFGPRVLVTFRGHTKGCAGPRLLLPLAEYLAEVRTTYRPTAVAHPAVPC